jgi:hypothetical protein
LKEIANLKQPQSYLNVNDIAIEQEILFSLLLSHDSQAQAQPPLKRPSTATIGTINFFMTVSVIISTESPYGVKLFHAEGERQAVGLFVIPRPDQAVPEVQERAGIESDNEVCESSEPQLSVFLPLPANRRKPRRQPINVSEFHDIFRDGWLRGDLESNDREMAAEEVRDVHEGVGRVGC